MTHRLLFTAPVLVCLLLPGSGRAYDDSPGPDPYKGNTIFHRPKVDLSMYAGAPYGPGYFCTGWPYGPRVAPPWTYPGLGGGPFVTYPWGSPGYMTRPGSHLATGLYFCSPPVPVYGPLPAIFDQDSLTRRKSVPQPGVPFGWVGRFAASPRPRPVSVSVWPTGGGGGGRAVAPAPAPGNACLTLAVRVPQPGAEIFVDGVKTAQTGMERVFESPESAPGSEIRYEVTARWVEGGTVREEKRVATGTPGAVVQLDFTAPPVIVTAKQK